MVGPAASPSAQVSATGAGACLLRTLRDGGSLLQEQPTEGRVCDKDIVAKILFTISYEGFLLLVRRLRPSLSCSPYFLSVRCAPSPSSTPPLSSRSSRGDRASGAVGRRAVGVLARGIREFDCRGVGAAGRGHRANRKKDRQGIWQSHRCNPRRWSGHSPYPSRGQQRGGRVSGK